MSTSVIKRDRLAAEAVTIYKSFVPSAGFVIIDYSNSNWSYSDHAFRNTIDFYAKKSVKKFHLKQVTPVHSSVLRFATGVSLGEKKRNNQIIYNDRTGAYNLEFSDGSILTLIKWISGAGNNSVMSCLLAGEESTFQKFLVFNKGYNTISSKPRNGIFTIKMAGNGQIYYDKLKKIQHTPVVHPSVEDVTNDLDNYFANVSEFTKYGMSGVRKILLVGPPGTGKSSYAYSIASRHKSSKSIVFADSISTVASHLRRCSKSNVPTIIIWEDAESTGLRNAGSDILNFLDGIDQPPTKLGAYIMMTTNFPELIDSRIKKRPGRVDRIFEFGVLRNEFALRCAQLYFYDLFPYKFSDSSEEARAHFSRLADIVNGMSGASIKGLAYGSKLYAAGAKLAMTLDVVEKVKKELDEDLSKVDKYAETEVVRSIGFGSPVAEKAHISWESLLKS